jgi:hypothetical protein
MFSNSVLARRIGRLAVVIVTVSAIACVDQVTAPSPVNVKAKAMRDSLLGDSTQCHSGFVIINGRIVCNGEG